MISMMCLRKTYFLTFNSRFWMSAARQQIVASNMPHGTAVIVDGAVMHILKPGKAHIFLVYSDSIVSAIHADVPSYYVDRVVLDLL